MVTVREAGPKDALAIAIVNVYTWKTAYTGLLPETMLDARVQSLTAAAQRTRSQLESGGQYLVAEEENTVIGFCAYGVGRNDAYPQTGEVYALYTLAGFQGLGVGRALLNTAAEGLRAMGYTQWIVNCLRGNPALGFYRRMGGRVIGERTDRVEGTVMTEDILLFGAAEA